MEGQGARFSRMVAPYRSHPGLKKSKEAFPVSSDWFLEGGRKLRLKNSCL